MKSARKYSKTRNKEFMKERRKVLYILIGIISFFILLEIFPKAGEVIKVILVGVLAVAYLLAYIYCLFKMMNRGEWDQLVNVSTDKIWKKILIFLLISLPLIIGIVIYKTII